MDAYTRPARKSRGTCPRFGLVAAAATLLALVSGFALAQEPRRLTPEEVIARMEQRNADRQERIRSWVSQRRYSAANPRLHKSGYMAVEMRYDAPATKTYRVIEKGGSGSVHSRVFDPLLKTEVEQAGPEAREATDITRRNYEFTFLRFDERASAYVFEAEPRTNNKYLFRGEMWVDAADLAVERIEGEPAQRPSFWIRKTHFVREYAKYGDFWFPVRHRTEVEVRLLGPSTMEIDYAGYTWQPATHDQHSTSVPASTTPN